MGSYKVISISHPIYVRVYSDERERESRSRLPHFISGLVRPFFFSPSDGSLSQTRKARIWSFHPEYLRRTVVIW